MGLRSYVDSLINPKKRAPYIGRAEFGDIQDVRLGANDFDGVGKEFAPTAYGSYYFTNTWVYRAVKLRANSVASARLRIMDRRPDGTLMPVANDNPVQEIFDRVNPWMTSADLWKTIETHLMLWGSAFFYVERADNVANPRPLNFWPIRADRVEVIPERPDRNRPVQFIKAFSFEVEGRKIDLRPDEVMWFRMTNPLDPYAGHAPVGPVRLTIDMSMDAVRFNRKFFTNGLMPGNLAFSWEDSIDDDEYELIEKRLDKRFKGVNKAHRPILLTNGAKAENLGLTQKDMEFLNTLQFAVEEVSRAYDVWPELLSSGTRAAFRNVRDAIDDFWLSTVNTEWQFLETEVTELLLPLFGERARNMVAQFDTSDVMAVQRARNEESRKDLDAVDRGGMTINEWRSSQGMEPVPWGDVWWADASKVPVSDETAPALPAAFGQEDSRSRSPISRNIRSAEKGMLLQERAMGEFLKALNKDERTFRSMTVNLFNDQKSSVLSKLRANHSKPGAEFFSPDAWNEKFVKRSEPLYEETLQRAAKRQSSMFGIRPLKTAVQYLQQEERGFNPFDRDDPGFKLWVSQRASWWAARTNEETGRLLGDELKAGRQAGEGLQSLQERVERVFAFNNATRSERIARTESVAATNKGHVELYRASGVVQQKRWLTSNDERVRETHFQPQRESPIDLDAKFQVGEDMMDAPGLGDTARENVNCRCLSLPVMTRR